MDLVLEKLVKLVREISKFMMCMIQVFYNFNTFVNTMRRVNDCTYLYIAGDLGVPHAAD